MISDWQKKISWNTWNVTQAYTKRRQLFRSFLFNLLQKMCRLLDIQYKIITNFLFKEGKHILITNPTHLRISSSSIRTFLFDEEKWRTVQLQHHYNSLCGKKQVPQLEKVNVACCQTLQFCVNKIIPGGRAFHMLSVELDRAFYCILPVELGWLEREVRTPRGVKRITP